MKTDKEIVTPADKLRAWALQAEARGDWDEAEDLNDASSLLLQLQAQNQAYRHSLSRGVIINIEAKKPKRLFR